jgi:branched-chain amino acid transport system substrate-binding protein
MKKNTTNGEERKMLRGVMAVGAAAWVIAAVAGGEARADDIIKIGLVQSMTGPFNTVGRAAVNGAKLYVQQHGDTVAGKKIELIVRDDGSVPDVGKRLAQDLIVGDKISILGGGITPSALTVAPLATEAKIPMVVMVSGASITTEKSPYIVRTSFTLGQSSSVMADWVAKNGAKKIVTIVNEWAPGIESETTFKAAAVKGGADIVETLRVPLQNPDFAPFLQRARDLSPDTLFVYFPGNQAGIFAKQFLERGMDKSGIRIVGPGDLTDDDELPGMTDAMLGIVTAHHYSANHPSALNKSFVTDFEKTYNRRPNFIAVGGYDGMHVIYEALKKTGGNTDGDALISAMKGLAWESPGGPSSIDPQTRDIVHNEYVRKVEKVNGGLYNVEFATYEAVKDPLKSEKK